MIDHSLIAKLPLFADLGPSELDALLQEARSVRYPKNAHVFQQGEEARSFFVLLHGHLRAEKTTPDGQKIVVRYVSTGEVFGVAEAIGLMHYPATATAVVESVALAWPSTAWARLIARHPKLAMNTLQTVGSRLQEAHTRVIEMSTEQVERRVAHAGRGALRDLAVRHAYDLGSTTRHVGSRGDPQPNASGRSRNAFGAYQIGADADQS